MYVIETDTGNGWEAESSTINPRLADALYADAQAPKRLVQQGDTPESTVILGLTREEA